ncbi:unnamed protein product, partial [Musa textilis]
MHSLTQVICESKEDQQTQNPLLWIPICLCTPKSRMDERFPPAVYFQYSPSGVHSSPSPHHSMSYFCRYLAGLLAERQKLGPFLQVLPFSCRLLNQEIVQASGLAPNQTFVHHERIEHVTPLRLIGHPSIGGPMDLEGWSGMHTEVILLYCLLRAIFMYIIICSTLSIYHIHVCIYLYVCTNQSVYVCACAYAIAS